MKKRKNPGRIYSRFFYDHHHQHSLNSAKVVLQSLSAHSNINRILDVGCGAGSWLLAANSVIPSVSRLLGVDGEWSIQEKNDRCYEFQNIDLETEFNLGERFDLVISMEVGEHLPHSAARTFVSSLVRHSDLVLFSAAIRGQGGTNHINEQPQSYWVELFSENQYQPYFFLRRQLWEDSSIGYWYRQNMCCFVKQDSSVDLELRPIEEKSKSNPLIDVAHPEALTSRSPGRVEQLGRLIDYRIWRAKSLARGLTRKRKPSDSSSP